MFFRAFSNQVHVTPRRGPLSQPFGPRAATFGAAYAAYTSLPHLQNTNKIFNAYVQEN